MSLYSIIMLFCLDSVTTITDAQQRQSAADANDESIAVQSRIIAWAVAKKGGWRYVNLHIMLSFTVMYQPMCV